MVVLLVRCCSLLMFLQFLSAVVWEKESPTSGEVSVWQVRGMYAKRGLLATMWSRDISIWLSSELNTWN